MNTNTVTWEEPPARRRGYEGVMPAIVEQLKSREYHQMKAAARRRLTTGATR